MLEIVQCAFADLAFADCFSIRLEVFVAEQNVPPEEEADEHDATALHFLALRNGIAAGTARVIFKEDKAAKVTRVAVRKAYRGLGVGAALMRHIEASVSATVLMLDAQTHALRFYESLGYETFGDEFLEAGIAHRWMHKRLS